MPNTAPEDGRVHVAVAVIRNPAGEILISRRAPDAHQGGLWEFPGGKVEAGETVEAALQREGVEELGIRILASTPLIRIPHDYPDKSILLDVREVTRFTGEAQGCENQPLAWVAPAALPGYAFPAANRPILQAATLPPCYLITPESATTDADFLDGLRRALDGGIRLIQLRARAEDDAFAGLAEQALPLCRQAGARLLLNADAALAVGLGADGVHLKARQLHDLAARPLPDDRLVAASCHSREDLRRAAELGIDFAVLGPVQPTRSHPGRAALGWAAFARLCEAAPLPVYALGGMQAADAGRARQHGGQGIAAIRGLWPGAVA